MVCLASNLEAFPGTVSYMHLNFFRGLFRSSHLLYIVNKMYFYIVFIFKSMFSYIMLTPWHNGTALVVILLINYNYSIVVFL